MKIPKNLSTEQLLEELETAEDTSDLIDLKDDTLLSDILKFISYFNLDKGEYLVHSRYIVRLFRVFTKKPFNKTSFMIFFNTVFPHRAKQDFYYVNKNILNILKIIETNKNKNKFIKNKYNPKIVNTTKEFLSNYDLKPGEYWVESFILSELYDDYRLKYKKPNYNKRTLTNIIGLMVESIETKHNSFVWFKLNKKALDIIEESRYNKCIEQRGLEWWKNVPKEVLTTEARERRKKAKDAIRIQNRMYKQRYKQKKLMDEKKKNTQH